MAKFGRFEFGKDQPSEVYVGDRMTVERGYVKILKGSPSLIDAQDEHLIAVIHLDKGQSMREIRT
jgi:hypothetical protein